MADLPPCDYTTIFRRNKKMSFQDKSIFLAAENSFFKVPSMVVSPQQRLEEFDQIKDKYLSLLSQNKTGVTIQLNPHPHNKELICDQHIYKFAQKKLVARGLCNRSYGAESLQLQIINYKQLIVNKGKYEIIAKAVVTEAVKQLEMFLINECHLKIEALPSQELSNIYNVLLNCRSKMKEEESDTFIGIVQAIYGLAGFRLTEVKALKIEMSIRESLFQAEKAKKQALKMNFNLDKQYKPQQSVCSKIFSRKNQSCSVTGAQRRDARDYIDIDREQEQEIDGDLMNLKLTQPENWSSDDYLCSDDEEEMKDERDPEFGLKTPAEGEFEIDLDCE